jgi:hypothetical protein
VEGNRVKSRHRRKATAVGVHHPGALCARAARPRSFGVPLEGRRELIRARGLRSSKSIQASWSNPLPRRSMYPNLRQTSGIGEFERASA